MTNVVYEKEAEERFPKLNMSRSQEEFEGKAKDVGYMFQCGPC